jgi:hypothetical protein
MTFVATRAGTRVATAVVNEERIGVLLGGGARVTVGGAEVVAGPCVAVEMAVVGAMLRGTASLVVVAPGSRKRAGPIVGSRTMRVAVERVVVGRAIVTTPRTTASTVLSTVG